MDKYDCDCTNFSMICSILSQQTTGRLEMTRIFSKDILCDSVSTVILIEKSSEVNLMIMPSYRIINDCFWHIIENATSKVLLKCMVFKITTTTQLYKSLYNVCISWRNYLYLSNLWKWKVMSNGQSVLKIITWQRFPFQCCINNEGKNGMWEKV